MGNRKNARHSTPEHVWVIYSIQVRSKLEEIFLLLRVLAVFCGVQLMVLAGHGICADAGMLDARRELSQQQHQDELLLRLQQNPRAASSPTLDLQQPQVFWQFEFQERQQQLLFDQHNVQQQDLHAWQGLKPRSETGSDARNELRRFAHERQQQLQRFEWERQQLQQSFTIGAPRLQAGSR